MSNAMKKLKILHHLTAASASHPPSHSSAAAQPSSQHHQQQQHNHHHHHQHQHQFPTPPASPVPPQATTTRQHYLSDARYRSDVLRSARAALYSMQGSTSPYLDPSCPHPQPSHNTMGRPPTQCLLPGGFMVLTPASSYDNTPGLCVPASPPPASMAINPHGSPLQNSVPKGNTTIYSSRPPAGSPSPKPSLASYQHPREQSRPCSRPSARPRLKLTKEAVAKIGKDSRLARWERVLGYVREQRSNTLPGAAAASPASDGYASLSGAPLASPPSKTIDRKRRAEQIATIEAQNHILDAIDLEEQDKRSLWSGGSGGTNGVDEFMWSEDEDDDIRPAPKAPPPQKIFPEGYVGSTSGRGGDVNDEGIFECEMQVDEYLQQPPTRLSTPGTPQDRKRARPRSSPEEIAFQRVWGKRIVEEMSVLCRENELDGGLGRLMGRRMSAAY